jgi:AraC-like DNA-binding protein
MDAGSRSAGGSDMTTSLPPSESKKPAFSNYYYYDDVSHFGIRASSRNACDIAEHVHANIQITIPIGETSADVRWHNADGKSSCSVAQRGGAIIIPPDQPHAVSWRNTARFLNLHIGVRQVSDDLTALLAGIAKAGRMHVVNDPFLCAFGENVVSLVSRGIIFDSNMMRGFRLLITEHMVTTYAPEYRDGLSRIRRHAVADQFLQLEEPAYGLTRPKAEAVKSMPAVMTGLAPWQLRKVTAIIASDLRRDRSISELAELVDLSKGHFSRAFRASTGLSPRQWIIHERIKLAIRQLSHTNDPLAEIAQNCGFAEQSHFTRTFTQVTGTSPGAWRRANKI